MVYLLLTPTLLQPTLLYSPVGIINIMDDGDDDGHDDDDDRDDDMNEEQDIDGDGDPDDEDEGGDENEEDEEGDMDDEDAEDMEAIFDMGEEDDEEGEMDEGDMDEMGDGDGDVDDMLEDLDNHPFNADRGGLRHHRHNGGGDHAEHPDYDPEEEDDGGDDNDGHAMAGGMAGMLGLPPMLGHELEELEGDDLNLYPLNHGGPPPLAPADPNGGGMRMPRHMGGGGAEMLSHLMRMVGSGGGPPGGIAPRHSIGMRMPSRGEFFPQGLNLGEFASDIMEARAGGGMMGMPIRMRIGDFDGHPMHIEVR